MHLRDCKKISKVLGFRGLLFVKELCVNVWYTLTMDLSVSIIDDYTNFVHAWIVTFRNT